ncbi:hypothetical protein AC578_4871 [Pseudocercospora eumusae]|uniref:Major facilitator superfamily (MFS) profile domain-containing protein n=1 Tax=Pseudocercospora eumusae TaxID=321146 RepID=A0A139HC50_9PEZI|nr:hypothetical protein AC578_4871 [Pseudocercospora eumusae]
MADSSNASVDKEKNNASPAPEGVQAPKPDAPRPPPNGGFQAWMQVISGFCLFFNNWGILNAFGVYQTYYESGELFEASSSDISWVGSLAAFMLLFAGLFAGPIFDRGYLRALLAVGSFLVVFGHMMLSISDKYYQVILSQGAAVGIGAGCLFVPCLAVVPQWFSTRLGAAMGIAVSGSALGGVIYPIVLNRLITEIGFPWAVRVIGFMAFGMLLIPIIFMRQRIRPPKARAFLDYSAFTDWSFMAFVLASFLNYMGLFVIFFYLAYYGSDNGITSPSLSLYLVSIFNTGSIFGRLVPNVVADRTGPFNLLAPSSILAGMLMLCMMAVHSIPGIVIIAIVSGFMSGALIGLPPLCLVAMAKAENKLPVLGTRVGMAYAMMAFGVLASGPAAGAVLGSGLSLDWHGLWTFAGVPTLVSGFMYYGIRIWKYGGSLASKA